MSTHPDTDNLNALSRASSAYLRSAMHQPIQWHEWSEEAFATAQRENKPILLDIGAVWCHWCHVMDRESYDDPAVAEIVNRLFVAVKVDRDERPDIDSRYQAAISAISGQGGWPLTAFLTPDGKPFYGGTYFPPSEQFGRPSFKRVLNSISEAFHKKSADVHDQARTVESTISQAESFAGRSGDFSPAVIEAIIKTILAMFDRENGGFGSSPKFPHPAALDLLIDHYGRTGDTVGRDVFVATLEKMARGGVYDQLGGGFHRYSVDERWVVPHFEKMSYDNSELLKNYVHAYQSTKTESFAETARDIMRWMNEWLSDQDNGGFYASQDADYSMEDDGDYFTWSVAEAQAVLTPEEFGVASLYYDINEIGEMHHDPSRNVLYVRASIEEIANRLKLSEARVHELLKLAEKKMYQARLRRPTPFVDKTMYVNWNAMCISAYLETGRALEINSAVHFALRSLDRLLAETWHAERGLAHVIAYSERNAENREVSGMLEDYAFSAVACLDAYEATADVTYFNYSKRICDQMIERFYDSTSGGFFDSADPTEESLGILGTRRKPFQDSPTPAGNSVATIALLRMHSFTNDVSYREKAEQTLELLAGVAGQYGLFAATYAIAAVHFSQPHTQVLISSTGGQGDLLARAGLSNYALGKTVINFDPGKLVASNLPPALAETLLALPSGPPNQPVAVVCTNFTCLPAVHTSQELETLLARRG